MHRHHGISVAAALVPLFFLSAILTAQPLTISPLPLRITGAAGDSAETHAVILNERMQSIRIIDAWLAGGGASPFRIASDIEQRLETDDLAVLRLVFLPPDSGTYDDELHLLITACTQVDTMRIPVQGDARAAGTAVLRTRPGWLEIPSTLIGDETPCVLRLENPSAQSLRIDSVTVTGVHAHDFTLTFPPPATIDARSFGSVGLRARSASPGYHWCQLQLHSGAGIVSAVITVPWVWDKARLDYDSILFVGSAMVGESASMTVSFRNGGTRPLVLTDFRFTGKDSAEFRLVGSDTVIVSPGRGNWRYVEFHPQATGDRHSTLHFRSNDPAHPTAEIAVFGTGLEYRRPDIAASRTRFDFHTYIGYPVTDTLMLYNRGNAKLVVKDIENRNTSGGWYSTCEVDVHPWTPFSIPAGDSLLLEITYDPEHPDGSRSVLVFHSDDPDTPETWVTMTGNSSYPLVLTPDPATVLFAPVAARDSADRILRFTHTGAGYKTLWLWGQEIVGPDRGSRIAFFRIRSADPVHPVMDVPLLGYDDVTSDVAEFPTAVDLQLTAWPNPTHGQTTLAFTMPRPASCTLTLVDRLGRRTLLLDNVSLSAGAQLVTLDAAAYPAGLYFCVLRADGSRAVRKLLVL